MASNLGVVELTICLHYCFDSPADKIIWDVGHQSYTHKLLTGRRDGFGSLRAFGGMSGFPKPNESEHDVFGTGHSSTSVSAALGFAVTRDLQKENFRIVSVIGDGSLTGGLAFEAMNNAGRMNTDMIVVLNDNRMSISENVGALSRYLNRIRTAPSYLGAKSNVENFLNRIPLFGGKAGKFVERVKNSLRYLLVPGALFEELGFTYVGPVDGHNINELIGVMDRVKKMKGPVLLHAYTVKGKGYARAEDSPRDFHGVDSFDIETGRPAFIKNGETYSDVFGTALCRIAERNKKIIAITAAMPVGTGLSKFAAAYPERCFDVGIAEGHATTFAAGVAKNGFIPVVAIYSTFLQRAYDQIAHDVCLQKLPVVFAVDRAGAAGGDGETHQGIFDLSYLTHIPNMTVMSPKNKKEFVRMIEFAIGLGAPAAIRYPRDAASAVLEEQDTPIILGKCEVIARGEKILLISFGCMMDAMYEVYLRLRRGGHSPGLINARFAKPVDPDMIKMIPEYDHCFVLEDGAGQGGFSSRVYEGLSSLGIKRGHYRSFSLPDEFPPQGTRAELFKKYGLDAESVYGAIASDIRKE